VPSQKILHLGKNLVFRRICSCTRFLPLARPGVDQLTPRREPLSSDAAHHAPNRLATRLVRVFLRSVSYLTVGPHHP
jgi:hypothetical protein